MDEIYRCESCGCFYVEPIYDFDEDGFSDSRCPHCNARNHTENLKVDMDLLAELLDGIKFDDINAMRSKWDKCKW